MDSETKETKEIKEILLGIEKNLKALVNLLRFEMQNKYVEKLHKEGFKGDEKGIRLDSYANTLKEIAEKE